MIREIGNDQSNSPKSITITFEHLRIPRLFINQTLIHPFSKYVKYISTSEAGAREGRTQKGVQEGSLGFPHNRWRGRSGLILSEGQECLLRGDSL